MKEKLDHKTAKGHKVNIIQVKVKYYGLKCLYMICTECDYQFLISIDKLSRLHDNILSDKS